MRARRRVVAVALCALAMLTACSSVGADFARRELPKPSGETGGPPPMGNIAYQPPFLPITFSIDTDGAFHVHAVARLVTLLGTVSITGGVVTRPTDKQPLLAQPADVTHLIICSDGVTQRCEAYQIGTGRKMRIDMNGWFVQEIERNRIIINAEAGSTITVTDVGPPSTSLKAHGPARRAIERVTFEEFGDLTELDLERSLSGTTTDLAYDHITGELKPINGAKIADVKKSSAWSKLAEEDLPSEYECQQANEWKDAFSNEDLQSFLQSFLIACIKTAEADLGYLVIWPDTGRKPVAYEFYSYVWVR